MIDLKMAEKIVVKISKKQQNARPTAQKAGNLHHIINKLSWFPA